MTDSSILIVALLILFNYLINCHILPFLFSTLQILFLNLKPEYLQLKSSQFYEIHFKCLNDRSHKDNFRNMSKRNVAHYFSVEKLLLFY